jgi:RNA polymerase sigma-70 factor (ECF subfamily)
VSARAVTDESGLRPVWRAKVGATIGGTVGDGGATGPTGDLEPGSAAAERRYREIDPFTLEAAQRGDRRAFDAIVDLYDERLRLLAFHLLRDADLADDALQDAFFNAYRGLPAFHRRSALGTWLYRITYTVCMGYLRQAREGSVSFEEAEEVIGADADPADAVAIRNQLGAALARISPEQRVVVLLVDRDGFDYQSVAEVLDVPKGTVCSRLVTARAALREALSAAQVLPQTRDHGPASPTVGGTV